MCTRISVFAPSTTNLDALEAWAFDCGVAIERDREAAGSSAETSILVTRSYCDCGTPIGSALRAGPRHDAARSARQLRTRGWSEAKIARALSQKKESRRRREARDQAAAIAGLKDWVTFFKGAPAHAGLTRIGVFYREDGRWLSDVDVKEGRRESSALASLDHVVLARLPEGILHEFSTGR